MPPFPSLVAVEGKCAKHGIEWQARAPERLLHLNYCPACGQEAIAAKRDEDEREFYRELAEARRADTLRKLEGADIPPRFREARLSDRCAHQGHEELMHRLRQYVEHWPLMLKRGTSFVLFGIRGTGKTQAVSALCSELMQIGATCAFLTQDKLSDLVRSAYGRNATRSEYEIKSDLLRFDLLAIDELGSGKDTENEVRMLNAIMHARHEAMKPTFVTSNLSRRENRALNIPPGIEEYLGQKLAERMNSWKWHPCNWPSYRTTVAYIRGTEAAAA